MVQFEGELGEARPHVLLSANAGFPCPFPPCSHVSNTEDELSEHTVSSHAGQHHIVSKSPFKCHCGQEFARLYTLKRHIQGTQKHLVPGYPCSKCTGYQGKNAFKRKDHLAQHLRVFHKYDNGQLATFSRRQQTRKFKISVCHFEGCDHYRDAEFENLGVEYKEKNRPFDKQSDYTAHMKLEHDWSPYPCKDPGCSKTGGKGFFSTTARARHGKKKHATDSLPMQEPHT